MPSVTALDGPTRAAQLLAQIAWADVENSKRWLPWISKEQQKLKDTGKKWRYSTACNIFASDMAKLYGAFFPRVYWTDEALEAIAAGVTPLVKYGETVHELSANALDGWMREWGSGYGWQAAGPELAQKTVNEGGFGLARAGKGGGIGHVSVIRPETEEEPALRDPRTGIVIAPAQCQAGARNDAYFATAWWNKSGHRGGLFVCPWTDPAELLKRAARTATDLLG